MDNQSLISYSNDVQGLLMGAAKAHGACIENGQVLSYRYQSPLSIKPLLKYFENFRQIRVDTLH